MTDALKSIAIGSGKVSLPIGVALALGWWYLDGRFAELEAQQMTLACFHLQAPEAREFAGCP